MSYMCVGSIKMWTQHLCDTFGHLFGKKFGTLNITLAQFDAFFIKSTYSPVKWELTHVDTTRINTFGNKKIGR